MSIDNKHGGSMHNNYALLLDDKLNNNEKAEYHYKQALKIDPDNATRNYNFSKFLKNRKSRYAESLTYYEKACQLQPNASDCYELKGQLLHLLNRFDESIDMTLHALKFNENDHHMNETDVKDAKQLIFKSLSKFIECDLKSSNYMRQDDGYNLMKWLYDNQLLSIKDKLLCNYVSIELLKECSWDDVLKLANRLNLTDNMKNKHNVWEIPFPDFPFPEI